MQLYLCEKPSQAKDIAAVLGCRQRENGAFKGEGKVVTWGFGHLLEQVEPEGYDESYKQWRMETLPIIPSVWKMKVKKEAKAQFAIVRKLVSQASEVVISTDADREGEVIAREILEYVNFTGSVKRLWLSALDESSIRQALATMKPGEETEKLGDAGVGRSRADWLLGMNMTRLCTIIGRDLGYTKPLSVGRVQSPTLRLVVDRDRQIENFVSLPFFDVVGKFNVGSQGFNAKWCVPEHDSDGSGRCLRREVAQTVSLQCHGLEGRVTLFETKRRKVKHPALFFWGHYKKRCPLNMVIPPKKS
nr:DNA topoisomerase [Photobacterium frigidiphilum]